MIKLNFYGADQRPPALYEFGKDPKKAFASPKYTSLIGCNARAEHVWPPHCESETDTMASMAPTKESGICIDKGYKNCDLPLISSL